MARDIAICQVSAVAHAITGVARAVRKDWWWWWSFLSITPASFDLQMQKRRHLVSTKADHLWDN
jgi:hypothetical protein